MRTLSLGWRSGYSATLAQPSGKCKAKNTLALDWSVPKWPGLWRRTPLCGIILISSPTSRARPREARGMNEAQRIRTALLASLSLQELSGDDRLRLVELTLGNLEDDRRALLAYEIAERLVSLGVLERIDRFQRGQARYTRYRVHAGEESFLLPTPEAPRDDAE